MRQTAHVKFGHTWRRGDPLFLLLIHQLVDGAFPGVSRARQARAALYGIIHSVSTHGGDVTVSADFADAIAQLQRSPHIDKSGKRSLQRIHIAAHEDEGNG
jgi:hypothetical protein